jgi:inner membrane protein
MPSPVGHVIAGVASGWLVRGAPQKAAGWREACLFGALGAAPDLDLLVGAHSGPTHSIGAAVIVGLVAFAVSRPRGQGGRAPGGSGTFLLAFACAAAYGSHVLLDWLSRDSTAPIGIMALWPFDTAHYESDLHLFLAVSRRYHQGWTFVRQNALALVRELVILVPVLMLIVFTRRRRDSQ